MNDLNNELNPSRWRRKPWTSRASTADPMAQFRRWYAQAKSARIPREDAMTLATLGPDGAPAARIVLYKDLADLGYAESDFPFFTNYESDKGEQLARDARAALVFHWKPPARQVRVEGAVEKLPEEFSDAYFATRPRASQTRRVGVAPEPRGPLPRLSGSERARTGNRIRGPRGSAPPPLGRIRPETPHHRVLAAPRQPLARPRAIHAGGERCVARREAWAVERQRWKTVLSEFSDYIVYADESGDHGLVRIDPDYPVFALAFCVIRKTEYIDSIVPSVQRFKFDFWGHDTVILHSHDIRKRTADFTLLLTDPNLRVQFFERLNQLIQVTPMRIFASVIDKLRLKEKYKNPWNPYQIALLFCMERILGLLLEKAQAGKIVHIVFESRGRKEDGELKAAFRQVCNNKSNLHHQNNDFQKIIFNPLFLSKTTNSTGLQLADLMARPIALNYLKPEQPNRAFEIVETKLRGLKLFP